MGKWVYSKREQILSFKSRHIFITLTELSFLKVYHFPLNVFFFFFFFLLITPLNSAFFYLSPTEQRKEKKNFLIVVVIFFVDCFVSGLRAIVEYP